MVRVKIYLVLGLVLMGVALAFSDWSDADVVAFLGLLAIALGFMQAHISLPSSARTALVGIYFAGLGAILRGGKTWEMVGSVILLVALLGNAIGVVIHKKESA